MKFWFNKERFFITYLIVISLFFLVLGTHFLLNIISTPTDENYYQEPASRLYVTKPFPVKSCKSLKTNEILNCDSIKVGALLFSINNEKVTSIEEVSQVLKNSKDEELTIVVVDKDIKGKEFVISKNNIPDNFLTYLNSAALIIEVLEDGASDRAGLRAGDIITKVNGNTFKNVYECNSVLLKSSSEFYIVYEILRNNQYFEIPVKLARIGVQFEVLILFILALSFLFIALFLGFSKPKIKPARILATSFLLLGSLYITATSYSMLEIDTLLMVFICIRLVIAYFAGSMFFHSLMYFPKERTELLRRKWIVIVPYIIAFLFSVVNIITINTAWLNSDISDIFLFVLFIYALIINLFFGEKLSREDRKIRRPVYIAYFVFFVFTVLNLLIKFLPVISPSTFTFNQAIAISKIQPYLALLILFPLSYIYVILHYRLFDIKLKFRRNFQYLVFTSFWKLGLIAVLFCSVYYLSQIQFHISDIKITSRSIEIFSENIPPVPMLEPNDANRLIVESKHRGTPAVPPLPNTISISGALTVPSPVNSFIKEEISPSTLLYEKLIVVLLSIVIAGFLFYIERKGQKYIDKKFHRLRFDYRRAATEISEIISKTPIISELSDLVIKELSVLLHLTRVGILVFKNNDKITWREFCGFDKECFDKKETETLIGKELEEFLLNSEKELKVDYLPDNLKEPINDYGFGIIISIRSKEKILGCLLLGDKLSETPFIQEDFEFFASIASQLSVAIENAFLYEDLTQQERIKHELEIARKIQLASLPQKVPTTNGIDVSGISIPALEVGGDFYDFLNGEKDVLTVVVGDVSGKGTSAALYMSQVQGIMRTLYNYENTPKNLFIRTNELLWKRLDKSSFITAICAKFEPKKNSLQLARAGHLPLLYLNSSNNEIVNILPNGIGLGISCDEIFEKNIEQIKIDFKPNDIFVFISDGITDARNAEGEDFGVERLCELIKINKNNNSQQIKDNIVDALRQFSAESYQYDDLTLVVVKIKNS